MNGISTIQLFVVVILMIVSVCICLAFQINYLTTQEYNDCLSVFYYQKCHNFPGITDDEVGFTQAIHNNAKLMREQPDDDFWGDGHESS